jgi:AcrR family transcriptional regulator
MSGTGKTETRRTLLAAATQVVREGGAASLTLEAVARAAGVSKGGLLYHFPTKEALIAAMIADLQTRFEAEVEAALAHDPEPGPGRWLRAFIRATFASPPHEIDLTASLLAAAGTNPDLLAPLRDAFAHWQSLAEADGLEPARATLIRLATDGLWFADLLRVAPPSGQLRTELLEAMLQLTRD